MNKDIIKILENNKETDYRILLTIDDKYIVYTNINNTNINENIYIIKIDENNNVIPISDKELKIVEKKYQNIINQKSL